MIPLFLQAMLEHPSQIIRFGESVSRLFKFLMGLGKHEK